MKLDKLAVIVIIVPSTVAVKMLVLSNAVVN